MDTSDPVPGWFLPLVAVLFGAGGAKLLEVWLENRRLTRKDYRETLLGRIQKVEQDLEQCHARSADLQERVGRLEERLADRDEDVERLELENDRLRSDLEGGGGSLPDFEG